MLPFVVLASLLCASCSRTSAGSTSFPLQVRKEFVVSTPGAAVAVAWSPDGSRFAAASNYGGVLSVWDRSGHLIRRISRQGGGLALDGSIAFAQGSSQLVFQPPGDAPPGTALAVWDIATGKVARFLPGWGAGHGGLNRASKFVMTPDQRLIAIADGAGGPLPYYKYNIFLYDARTWRFIRGYRLNSGVFSLGLFNHARSLVIGSGKNSLALLDLSAGAALRLFRVYPLSKYGQFPVEAVAGSPDGNLVAGGVGLILFFEANQRAPQVVAWRKSFDPVWVLRASDGARLGSLKPAFPPLRQAAWDPKGRYVALLDDRDGLFLWRPLASKTNFLRVNVPGSELSVAISPAGDRIAVTSALGISVYDVSPKKGP